VSGRREAAAEDRTGDWLAHELERLAELYRQRGLFQSDRGFGRRPAVVVVDLANGWTNTRYATACVNVGPVVSNVERLLAGARRVSVPVFYTRGTRRHAVSSAFSEPVPSSSFVAWDCAASEIDRRVAPRPSEALIEKEAPSALFGTTLLTRLKALNVDTVVLAGVTTSGCVRATANDSASLGFKTVVVADCCGDRSALLERVTLFDLQGRICAVRQLGDVLSWLEFVVSSDRV